MHFLAGKISLKTFFMNVQWGVPVQCTYFLTGPKWKLSNIAHEDEMLVFIAIKEHQK